MAWLVSVDAATHCCWLQCYTSAEGDSYDAMSVNARPKGPEHIAKTEPCPNCTKTAYQYFVPY
jgi:hypothetical protein